MVFLPTRCKKVEPRQSRMVEMEHFEGWECGERKLPRWFVGCVPGV